jgi:hypothetical protein
MMCRLGGQAIESLPDHTEIIMVGQSPFGAVLS